jgi:hypothetical protein
MRRRRMPSARRHPWRALKASAAVERRLIPHFPRCMPLLSIKVFADLV